MTPLTEATLRAAERSLRRVPTVLHDIDVGRRTWHIEAVADQAALTAAAEAFEPFPFGLVLWDAAPVLADAVAAWGADLAGRSVLELGAGTGLVGLVAAAQGARVVQTDHSAEALALCASNAARNAIADVRLALADWTSWRAGDRYDVIIGSDILYEAEMHDAVLGVLEQALNPAGVALLSDPGRTAAPAFIRALEGRGWSMVRRRRRVPALQPMKPGETAVVTLIEARR